MSKKRFAMVSEAMLSDRRLTGRQFKVLCALRLFADRNTGEGHPKRSQIADITGVSENHISSDTRALEVMGWIKKTGNGGLSTASTYRVFDEPQTRTETVQVNPSQNGTGNKRQTRTESGLNPYRIGTDTRTESGLNPSQNGTAQVTDQQQTIEQTNNRPVAATPKKSRALTATKPAPADAAAPEKSAARNTLQDTCRETWGAYALAYKDRYGIEPVRNSKINTQVVQFCKRVPLEEAPKIAAHYVASNAAFYVGRGHQFGNLLADAEKLRTEWATGNQITAATARQIDATQSNFNAVQRAVAMATGRRNA